MKARPDIDPHRIGLWGVSQAGYVMPRVLSQSEDIAFMICVSCPGMSGDDQSTYQAMALALCARERRRRRPIGRRNSSPSSTRRGPTRPTRSTCTTERCSRPWLALHPSAPKGRFEVVPEEAWRERSRDRGLWNPIEVIEQTTIPVLAIFGDRDRQIDPIQGAYAYRKALEQAGNPKSRVELFPGPITVSLVSETGCPDDDLRWLEQYVKTLGYGSMSEAQEAILKDPGLMSASPFAPGYLDLIEEWLFSLAASTSPANIATATTPHNPAPHNQTCRCEYQCPTNNNEGVGAGQSPRGQVAGPRAPALSDKQQKQGAGKGQRRRQAEARTLCSGLG